MATIWIIISVFTMVVILSTKIYFNAFLFTVVSERVNTSQGINGKKHGVWNLYNA